MDFIPPGSSSVATQAVKGKEAEAGEECWLLH